MQVLCYECAICVVMPGMKRSRECDSVLEMAHELSGREQDTRRPANRDRCFSDSMKGVRVGIEESVCRTEI